MARISYKHKKGFDGYRKDIMIVAVSVLALISSFLLDGFVARAAIAVQNPILFYIFYAFSMLGEWYIFMWIAIFLTVTLIIHKRPFLAFTLSVVTSAITYTLLKIIIERPRPFESLHLPSLVPTSLSSFPSGHAAIMFSLIPIFGKEFPSSKIILWIVASIVCISRLYFDVHYLSDVVAGAMLGYGIGWIFLNISEHYRWKW